MSHNDSKSDSECLSASISVSPNITELLDTLHGFQNRPKSLFPPQVPSFTLSSKRSISQPFVYSPSIQSQSFSPNKKTKQRISKMGSFFEHGHGRSEKSINSKKHANSLQRSSNHKNIDLLHNIAHKKTFYGVISNFYLTRKFISQLKNLTSKRTPKYLNPYHFELMNDRSFFYDQYCLLTRKDLPKEKPNQSFFKKAVRSIVGKISKLGVFDINKSFTMCWNLIAGFSMIFFFVYIPIFTCFQGQDINDFKLAVILKNSALLVLLGDIAKSLNTSFYRKGSLIRNRKEIANHYLRTQFILDFLSLGPLFYHEISFYMGISEDINSYTRFATFLVYLKLRQFTNIVKKFEEMLFIDEFLHNTLALVKLIFRILLLTHIFACLWYIVGTTKFYRTTWINHYDFEDDSTWIKYLYSYYYVCVTMNTVGYGDFSPQNPLETIFAIVFIYIACGVFAYSLNSIGMIVSDLTKRSKELSKQLNVINEFMNEKQISFDLRMRVRNYLEYIFKEEKIEKVEEQGQIIKKLSESIKEELLIEAHGGVIRDVKFFSLNFSEDTLRKTVLIMKEVRYTPGDIIFLQNDYNNKDLFLIRKGMVELFIESYQGSNDISVIKRMKEKDIFGEKSFFSNRERSVSARSLDFTTVYVINQEEFINILRKNAKDFEKFCEIKDKINLYADFSDIYTKCTSCLQNTHLIDHCPILHYMPAADIIIHRYLYNPFQERKDFSRNKSRRKVQTLIKAKNIEQKAYIFQNAELTKQESEEEFEEEEDYGTTFNTGNSQISQKLVAEDSDMPEIKEQLFEDEDFNSFEREPESARLDPYKRKIHRRSTKKNAILVSKKSSMSRSLSRSFMDRSRTDENFNIESLENLELQDSSSSNTLPQGKIITIQSFLHTLYEMFKKKNNSEHYVKKITLDTEFKDVVNAVVQERSFDIDGIKCYEEYYPDGNVEEILERVKEFQKKRFTNKRIKRSKSVYSILMPDQQHRERIRFQPKKMNIMRRNFFKNARNLEKLLLEEQFDVAKFKAYYIKRYERKGIGVWGRMVKCLRLWWDKRRIQKKLSISRVRTDHKDTPSLKSSREVGKVQARFFLEKEKEEFLGENSRKL